MVVIEPLGSNDTTAALPVAPAPGIPVKPLNVIINKLVVLFINHMFEASLFSNEATVTTKVPEPPQPKSDTEKVIVSLAT